MAKIPQLSDPQIRALRLMNEKRRIEGTLDWQALFVWEIGLSTVQALVRKGLIEKKDRYLDWRITEKGRALIKEIVDERD